MAFLKVKNRAFSTLASGISDSDLSLTVATGEGALFPSTYPFHVTICVAGNPETNIEIVECSSRTGDVLTIVRAQEGTAAVSHAADELVGLRITADIITRLQKQLLDDDGDTGFEVEQTADEDKIHGKVGGVEAFLLSAVGIQTLAKQSGARGNRITTTQNGIPATTAIVACYNEEAYDQATEFDTTITDGTVHADTSGTTLVATASIFASGDVGKSIWNTTDDTYTTISAYTNATTVTVAAAIFATAETFSMYSSRFTATEPGIYFASQVIQYEQLADTEYADAIIRKNGSTVILSQLLNNTGGALTMIVWVSGFLELAANDYVEAFAFHSDPVVGGIDLHFGRNYGNFAISKVA